MTQPSEGVRGATRSRGGATDTTMLIWKVIAAEPGIDRAGIWAKVEHGIPEGYALRRYARSADNLGRAASRTRLNVREARSFILSEALGNMRRKGLLSSEGAGRERRFVVAREPRYCGDKSTVDETGTKAAEHMALVDAWRVLGGLVARCKPENPRANPKVSIKEAKALRVAFDAWRSREVPP